MISTKLQERRRERHAAKVLLRRWHSFFEKHQFERALRADLSTREFTRLLVDTSVAMQDAVEADHVVAH